MTSYVRHTKSPAWGVGVLVRQAYGQQTYLFADGVARTFKTAIAAALIESTAEPDAEDRRRLELGLGALAAAPDSREARSVTATPKAIHLGLEAEIRAARDEADPHLVYADWLQSKGDPRGELIVAHHQLALAHDDKRRQLAASRLLAEHADYFVPAPLAAMLERGTAEVAWHLGYFDRVRLARRSSRTGELLPVLASLLAHPSGRFVRALVLGPLGDDAAYDYRPLVEAIADAKPELLAELVVGDFTPRDTTLAFTRIGNATSLIKALPQLRSLVLRGGKLALSATPRHDRLEQLAIETTDARGVFTRIASAKLPALRSLEIAAPNLDPTPTEVAHLLSGKGLPALRRLVLRDTVRTARLFDAILMAPQLARLDELGLPGGDLADAMVPGLVARAATWRHLRLDVSGNPLGAVAARHLTQAGQVVATPGSARPVDEASVLALAPTVRVAGAARELADSHDWLELGRERDRVWGRLASSTSGDYWVSAHVVTRETTCTCSARRPCAHALALLVIAARGRAIDERPRPAGFRAGRSRATRYRPGRE